MQKLRKEVILCQDNTEVLQAMVLFVYATLRRRITLPSPDLTRNRMQTSKIKFKFLLDKYDLRHLTQLNWFLVKKSCRFLWTR
jgi:hypothetical protein